MKRDLILPDRRRLWVNVPRFLVERATFQQIPPSFLLERRAFLMKGMLVFGEKTDGDRERHPFHQKRSSFPENPAE